MVRRRRAGRIGRHRPLIPATEPMRPHAATRLFTADRSDGRLFLHPFSIPTTTPFRRHTSDIADRALFPDKASPRLFHRRISTRKKRDRPSGASDVPPSENRPGKSTARHSLPPRNCSDESARKGYHPETMIREKESEKQLSTPLSQRKFRLSPVSVLHIAKLNCILAVRNQIKIYIHGKFQTSYFQRTGSGCPAG